ncbi:MAG TPA: CcmD family protein [Longimicrobium sp.]
MRPTRLIIAALALGLAPAPRLVAQEPSTATVSAQPPTVAPAEQTLQRTVADDARPATPPATMRAYWHVFAAFAIAWLAIFGYAISLGRRFRNLEREVDALHGTS